MKVCGKEKVLIATPLAMVVEEVTLNGLSTQIPSAPYAAVAQVQPIVVELAQKIDEEEVTIADVK